MMWTLRPPNIDTATITGMIHDMTPSTVSANVCGKRRKRVATYPIVFKTQCKYVCVWVCVYSPLVKFTWEWGKQVTGCR
jgi:hypothetical protein